MYYNQNVSDFYFPQNDSYYKSIDLYLNLSHFGIAGDQYAVSIKAGNQVKDNGSLRTIEDSIGGILFPTPQYTISAPQSLDLKPGEKTVLKVGITSPIALESQVRLSSPPNPYVDTKQIMSEGPIAKQGTNYLTFSLEALKDAAASNFVLPIIANVTFPKAEMEPPLEPLTYNSSLAVTIIAPEPLSIPPELLATIITIVISAIIGWSIPSIASYISSRKHRRNFLEYITTIDNHYDTEKDNIYALKDWLTTFEREMQYALGNGKISESQYDLLKKKIDYYINDHVHPEER